MTSDTNDTFDQEQIDWALEALQQRGSAIESAIEALLALGRGAVSAKLVDMEKGFSQVVYKGRPWGIEARPVMDDWPGFWQLHLHDMTGPVRDDGSQGRQEPGVILNSTAKDPTVCIPHHIRYLWDYIKNDHPGFRRRLINCGGSPFGCVNLWDGHKADCLPARLYRSSNLREITAHVPGRSQWTVYATKREARHALTFLAWLLLGYDPPDGLLMLENRDVREVWNGLPSEPVTWSEWKRQAKWKLTEVWTVQAALAERDTRMQGTKL